MINKNSVIASMNLVNLFADRNQVIKPKSGSVISELVRLSNLVNENIYPSDTSSDNYTYMADAISMASSGIDDAQSEHDLCIDSLTNEINGFIQNHISFAKNVVKPIVVKVAEEAATFLKNEGSKSAESNFCIKVCALPEVLEDGVFTDNILKHEGKNLLKPDGETFLGSKTDEEIQALMLTGDSDVDQQIIGWLSRQDTEFLQTVWQNFFVKQSEINMSNYVSYDRLFSMDIFEKSDYALGVYLVADKLFDTVDETASGIPLAAYKLAMGQIREVAAICLSDALRRIGSYKTSQMLVVSLNPDNKTISVFGDVYNQWLETNGSSEIILGVLVSDSTYRTVPSINEHHEALQEYWRQYNTFFQANRTLNVFNYFKDALRMSFLNATNDVEAIEQSFIDTTPGHAEKVNQILEYELNSLCTGDMDDLFLTALKIVARARFYYTDAECILCDISQAAKVNPNINVREAALLSAINYIADYVSDQFEVVKF